MVYSLERNNKDVIVAQESVEREIAVRIVHSQVQLNSLCFYHVQTGLLYSQSQSSNGHDLAIKKPMFV